MNISSVIVSLYKTIKIKTVPNQVVRREEEASFPVTARSTLTILVENMGYMAWLSQGLGDYSNEYKGKRPCNVEIKFIFSFSFILSQGPQGSSNCNDAYLSM